MRCPYCGHHDLKVVDSRDSEVGEAIRRRRECLQCGQRFTTYERIEAVPFYVTKKDGRREDVDPQKLFTGLKKATEQRDISPERLRAIVDDIEAELRAPGASRSRAGRSARWSWIACATWTRSRTYASRPFTESSWTSSKSSARSNRSSAPADPNPQQLAPFRPFCANGALPGSAL